MKSLYLLIHYLLNYLAPNNAKNTHSLPKNQVAEPVVTNYDCAEARRALTSEFQRPATVNSAQMTSQS
jgi:hypothetical protein